VARAVVHAVEREGVKVHIQGEVAPKPLHHCDAAAASVLENARRSRRSRQVNGAKWSCRY